MTLLMSYDENLSTFAVLLFGIIIVPGMDMLFVITNARTGGHKAGLAATAGITFGRVFHTLPRGSECRRIAKTCAFTFHGYDLCWRGLYGVDRGYSYPQFDCD